MKKKILGITILLATMCLTGCVPASDYESSDYESSDSTHKGKCLEYRTEYRLDCGFFVSDDSFCKERKYDVCARWEEE